ncbi:MAG TPA: phosphoglycerate dehydrogenase [Acidimicrobiales bacterium]|nr:phosphoglycerate dehydrogenase [Acidimicrobiales bacterium]
MARVLVTEPLAESGLALLRDAGHDVAVRLDLSPEELLEAVAGAAALVVRSATKVTAEVIDAADHLVAVGRAGAGVDNIDVAAATRKGVMVINAPGSNSLSTAEHAVALLLALARNVPQADRALKAGRWEKSRWQGVELHGKTLGVLGLGRIGTLVAQRMHAFGMRVVARDPFVTPERARQLGIELVDSYEELVAVSDFLTIHANKTKETTGLIGAELLAHAKPGIRIVNAARGGIVDEAALAEAIRSGRVAGAALDVFDKEPTVESPLFDLDGVVVTPHLAASTQEAQDKAGQMIAEQLRLALAGDFVPFAVNVEAADVPASVRPFLALAERLGHLFALLAEDSIPDVLDIAYQGELAGHDTRLLKLAVLRGVLGAGSDEPVSYVNAPQLAEERGMQVRESTSTVSDEYVNLISISGDRHSLAGTLTGRRGEPRIVMLDGHDLEVPLADHLLVVRNDDRVGMMALVTATVAEAGVNIADMRLGRTRGGGTALAVITSDAEIPASVGERLAGRPGILDVVTVNAGGVSGERA